MCDCTPNGWMVSFGHWQVSKQGTNGTRCTWKGLSLARGSNPRPVVLLLERRTTLKQLQCSWNGGLSKPYLISRKTCWLNLWTISIDWRSCYKSNQHVCSLLYTQENVFVAIIGCVTVQIKAKHLDFTLHIESHDESLGRPLQYALGRFMQFLVK